jgi:hypothetical protein
MLSKLALTLTHLRRTTTTLCRFVDQKAKSNTATSTTFSSFKQLHLMVIFRNFKDSLGGDLHSASAYEFRFKVRFVGQLFHLLQLITSFIFTSG